MFPSSSTPRVLKRVPARLAPKREIKLSVATVGAPLVGGAGSGIVNMPTKPCMARTYPPMEKDRLKTDDKKKIAHDKLTPVQVFPLLHVQTLPEVKQAANNVLVPHEAVVERAEVGHARVAR